MAFAQLQSLLSLFAMVLIPLGVGGAGFLLFREAGLRAQRRLRLGRADRRPLRASRRRPRAACWPAPSTACDGWATGSPSRIRAGTPASAPG